jgi:hypothetical protein
VPVLGPIAGGLVALGGGQPYIGMMMMVTGFLQASAVALLVIGLIGHEAPAGAVADAEPERPRFWVSLTPGVGGMPPGIALSGRF